MTTPRTIAAAGLWSAFTVTPVFAQAAIGEPGAYAFYHPDRDVLNGGAPTSPGRLAAEPQAAFHAYAQATGSIGLDHLQHRRTHKGR
jgi:hypothetical protein